MIFIDICGGAFMVRFNEDKEVVAAIKEGLKARGGYCPEGYCHCGLYYKSKD